MVVVVAVEIEAARHGNDFAAARLDGNERTFHLGQLAQQPAVLCRVMRHANHAALGDGALAIERQLAAQTRVGCQHGDFLAIAQLRRQLALASRVHLAHEGGA